MTLGRGLGPIALTAVLLFGHTASAQQPVQPDQPDPLDAAMVRIGPLGINPTVSVHDVGRDENVFDDPTNPKSDFTFTLSPKAEVLFRPRIMRLDYTSATDYVYYQTYTSERSTNETSSLRADFDFSRVQPFVTLQGIDSKERYSQEVDVRVRHHQTSYGTGAAFKIATRTSVTAGVRQSDLSFDPGTTFRGTDLAASFDNRLRAIDASVAVQLTPFTTATVTATEEQQRFTVDHVRDSNSLTVAPTVSFSPQAILSGSASIGYTRFSPLSPLVPSWSGVTAGINLSTALLGRYKIDGSLSRAVAYSYDPETPYYLTTGGTVTATIAVVGPFDVKATGTRQLMAYRSGESADTAAGIAGTDTYTAYGGGIGYKVRDQARLGMNADWSYRASQLSSERNYRNRRIYASLTWGVQ